MRVRWLLLLWGLAAVWMGWWLRHNPLPDGFQNEFLHVGNAFDLWHAWLVRDGWHLRWYSSTSYWPPGFYAVPAPALLLEALWQGTQSREALVAGNLVHLAVLLWALRDLGRLFGAPLAPALALFCPGVFGSLVRFEPNLAAIAWTAAALVFLVRSEGLRRRGQVVLFGLALGLGLLMDRLSVAFFIGPAALALMARQEQRQDRAAWRGLGLALLVALVIAGPWYAEFFRYNAEEIVQQAPVGEIDSAGQVTEAHGPLALLYYPLALLDSQAGPVLGALMLVGLAAGAAGLRRGPLVAERGAVVAAAAGSLLFFTLIAKKQVYYTLPALGPLALLAARSRRGAWVGLAGGLWSFGAVGLGLWPGGPWLPERWVSPRHTLARPPSFEDWPLDAAVEALGPTPRAVAVLSEDEDLFEGFAVAAARERWMWAEVRGVTLDPQGSFERWDLTDAFLWVGPAGALWPGPEAVAAQLVADHLDLSTLPDISSRVASSAPRYREVARWHTDTVDIVAFRRRGSPR